MLDEPIGDKPIFNNASFGDTRHSFTVVDLQRAYLCILERNEPQHITVNKLISEAGISRATFYRHFGSLKDVIHSIIDRPIDRLVDLILGRFALEDQSLSSRAIIDMIMDDPRLWRILLTSGDKIIVYKEIFVRALSRGEEIAQYLHPELPSDYCAAWTVIGTFEILSWWLSHSNAPPEAAIASLIERLTLRPALRKIYDDQAT